jgi:hypothetical protein
MSKPTVHLRVTKAFECPWHRSERRDELRPGNVDRWCDHPVNRVEGCSEANVPPPGNCPLRKADVVVEVG